ncbi:unnamed protein product, partial [Ectocarpus fasciculatus]
LPSPPRLPRASGTPPRPCLQGLSGWRTTPVSAPWSPREHGAALPLCCSTLASRHHQQQQRRQRQLLPPRGRPLLFASSLTSCQISPPHQGHRPAPSMLSFSPSREMSSVGRSMPDCNA